MLEITEKTGFLSQYTPVGFDFCQEINSIGRLTVSMHPKMSSDKPASGIFAKAQDILGESATCSYDNWSFSGIVHNLEYDSVNNIILVTVLDVLSKPAGTVNSRVFAGKSLKQAIPEIITGDLRYKVSPGFGKDEIKLQIQYQETDFAFLKRLACCYGGCVWCHGDTICIGQADQGKTIELIIGRDIWSYKMITSLGWEKLELLPISYKDEQSDAATITSRGALSGEIQKKAVARREKSQGAVAVHTIIEDKNSDYPDNLGRRCIKAQAAGKLLVVGAVSKPIPVGACVRIKNDGDSSGDEGELLMVHSLRSRGSMLMQPHFSIEAVPIDFVPATTAEDNQRLYYSAAQVKETNDKFNRVRVVFPWDANRTVTPWLRMLSAYWGKKHRIISPPEPDDTVVVMWGQETHDPVVLGCVANGNPASEPISDISIKTGDGREILFHDKEIKIINEKKGQKSSLEILPGKIRIDSGKIELKARQIDVK